MLERDFFLTTDRIGFSEWTESDRELAKLLWGDPEVTRFICATGKFSENEIAERLKKEIENNREYHVQYWPVFKRDSNELIGCCGLRPYSEKKYELGFHLRPKFWGQGYAVEAAEAVIEYAFSVLKAEGLFAGHNPHNTASSKVLMKLGFTYIGDQFYEPTGLYHPSYVMYQLPFYYQVVEVITKMNYEIIRLTDKPEIKEQAAQWFHEKWQIPTEAYRESMEDSIRGEKEVPQWYLAIEGDRIIGGLGVIENDFHDRKDLTPNVCAVYTEEDKRCQGIAGALLNYVCMDMKKKGIDTLYLVTDHTSFYERYGWEFLCMVQGEGEPDRMRMYIHKF